MAMSRVAMGCHGLPWARPAQRSQRLGAPWDFYHISRRGRCLLFVGRQRAERGRGEAVWAGLLETSGVAACGWHTSWACSGQDRNPEHLVRWSLNGPATEAARLSSAKNIILVMWWASRDARWPGPARPRRGHCCPPGHGLATAWPRRCALRPPRPAIKSSYPNRIIGSISIMLLAEPAGAQGHRCPQLPPAAGGAVWGGAGRPADAAIAAAGPRRAQAGGARESRSL